MSKKDYAEAVLLAILITVSLTLSGAVVWNL